MTSRVNLPYDSKHLLDNFQSFRQGFSTLVEKTRRQEDQLRSKEIELNDARKKILAMEQVEEENKRLKRSLEQLKSLRIIEQTKEHERKLAEVVAEYEVKLRDAEKLIYQLTNCKIKTGITSEVPTTSHPSNDNNSQNFRRWPKLSVDITSSSSANPPAETKAPLPNPRAKRKLFTLDRESIEDVI